MLDIKTYAAKQRAHEQPTGDDGGSAHRCTLRACTATHTPQPPRCQIMLRQHQPGVLARFPHHERVRALAQRKQRSTRCQTQHGGQRPRATSSDTPLKHAVAAPLTTPTCTTPSITARLGPTTGHYSAPWRARQRSCMRRAVRTMPGCTTALRPRSRATQGDLRVQPPTAMPPCRGLLGSSTTRCRAPRTPPHPG